MPRALRLAERRPRLANHVEQLLDARTRLGARRVPRLRRRQRGRHAAPRRPRRDRLAVDRGVEVGLDLRERVAGTLNGLVLHLRWLLDRRGSQREHARPPLNWQRAVEVLHQYGVRVGAIGVVRLVEDQQGDLLHRDPAGHERTQELHWRAHHDLAALEDVGKVGPLVVVRSLQPALADADGVVRVVRAVAHGVKVSELVLDSAALLHNELMCRR